MKIKSALSPSQLPGLDHALNPYRGCEHGCVYCYSPDVLRLENWREWGKFAEPKENMPVILAKELKRKKPVINGKESYRIGIGTVTDPYQPQEAERKITRYCLEQIVRKPGWKVTIQTKSDLILRDIDILSGIEDLEAIITITTMDAELARKTEPGASEPDARIRAVRELSDAGIKTWVFLGPIIPGLNDGRGSLGKIVELASEAGAEQVMFDKLRLKPCVSKRMALVFGDEFDGVREKLADKKWWASVSEIVETACHNFGIKCKKAF